MKNKLFLIMLLLLIIVSISRLSFSDSTTYENLLNAVNTDGDETSCSLSGDGKTFLFTRKTKSEKQYDIYITRFQNGNWSKPELLKEINSESDEVSPLISRDGQTLIFASNRQGSQKNVKASKPSFDLYLSQKKGNAWSEPVAIKGDLNTTDDETNPHLSSDGSIITFTRTYYKDPSKTTIIEAEYGDTITAEKIKTSELSLQTIIRCYLARKSEYRSGSWVSGFIDPIRDIYFVYTDSDGNTEVIDPGDSINTDGDDNSVFEISKDLVFVSSNTGISSSYDIFLRKVPADLIPGTVEEKNTNIEKETKQETKKETKKTDTKKEKTDTKKEKIPDKEIPVETTRTLILDVISTGIDNPREVSLKVLLFDSLQAWKDPVDTKTVQPDSNNKIEITVSSKIKRIVVIPASDDIDGFAAEYIVDKKDLVRGTLKLSKSTGKQFEFRPVYFEFNSSEILLSDIPYIHELLDYLRNNTSVRISIEGYSDGIGSYRANMDLSIRRAKKVKNYLVKRGIDSSRIKIKGHGFVRKQLKDTFQQNRRVDFFIIQ